MLFMCTITYDLYLKHKKKDIYVISAKDLKKTISKISMSSNDLYISPPKLINIEHEIIKKMPTNLGDSLV